VIIFFPPFLFWISIFLYALAVFEPSSFCRRFWSDFPWTITRSSILTISRFCGVNPNPPWPPWLREFFEQRLFRQYVLPFASSTGFFASASAVRSSNFLPYSKGSIFSLIFPIVVCLSFVPVPVSFSVFFSSLALIGMLNPPFFSPWLWERFCSFFFPFLLRSCLFLRYFSWRTSVYTFLFFTPQPPPFPQPQFSPHDGCSPCLASSALLLRLPHSVIPNEFFSLRASSFGPLPPVSSSRRFFFLAYSMYLFFDCPPFGVRCRRCFENIFPFLSCRGVAPLFFSAPFSRFGCSH